MRGPRRERERREVARSWEVGSLWSLGSLRSGFEGSGGVLLGVGLFAGDGEEEEDALAGEGTVWGLGGGVFAEDEGEGLGTNLEGSAEGGFEGAVELVDWEFVKDVDEGCVEGGGALLDVVEGLNGSGLGIFALGGVELEGRRREEASRSWVCFWNFAG